MLLCACQNNEADIPELNTRNAQVIGGDSAVLDGELAEIGPVRPVTIGFLWDVQEDINIATAKNKYIIGTTDSPRTFSVLIDKLLPDTTYYYRSFAATNNFSNLYYGQVISFTTLP